MRSLACVLLIACGSPSVNGPRNAPGPIVGEAPPTSDTEATAPPQPDPELAHLARPEKAKPAPVPVVTSSPAPVAPPPTNGAHVTLGELHLRFPSPGAKELVERTQNQFLACYAKEQADVPSLAGKITVEFTIDLDGKVRKVKTSAGVTLTVGQCVGDAIRGLSFFKPTNPNDASIALEFSPTRS